MIPHSFDFCSLSSFYASNLHIIRQKLILSMRILLQTQREQEEAFIPDCGNRTIVDINWYSKSTNDATIQDPRELSAIMTQASEGIQNELAGQRDKLTNQLVNTFGFNEIQSQISLGYQFAFEGNTSGAISDLYAL